MRLSTRTITLEGCDLSGKSTLYASLHKVSNFAYDIRDRGRISRVVYPRVFGRDNTREHEELIRDLDDLNNVFVFLAPDWDTVTARFASRGDEMHDLVTLRKTWEEFNRHALALQDHPSVLVYRDSPSPDRVLSDILARETLDAKDVADRVRQSLQTTDRNESLDMRFDLSVSFLDNPGSGCLFVPGEEEYYSKIEKDFFSRISHEMKNGQSASSRRFVTVNSSCISYIRFIHRDAEDILDIVCRSTNVPKNLKHDLEFAVYLGLRAQVAARLPSRPLTVRARLNCAHIVP